jgi:hypothetical protein
MNKEVEITQKASDELADSNGFLPIEGYQLENRSTPFPPMINIKDKH